MSCDVKPESCEERLERRRMPAGKGCYTNTTKQNKRTIMHQIKNKSITQIKKDVRERETKCRFMLNICSTFHCTHRAQN
jgi:hypothetical protein